MFLFKNIIAVPVIHVCSVDSTYNIICQSVLVDRAGSSYFVFFFSLENIIITLSSQYLMELQIRTSTFFYSQLGLNFFSIQM